MFDELRDLRNSPLFSLTKQEIQGRLALIGDEHVRLTKELNELHDMDLTLRLRLTQLAEPVSTKRNIHEGYVDISNFRTEFQGTRKISETPIQYYAKQATAVATPRTSNADAMAESFLGKLDKSVQEDTDASKDYYDCHPAFTN